MASRAVTATPSHGKQMTLADLRAFVTEMDQAGAAGTTPVAGRVTMIGSWLTRLTATAVPHPDHPGLGRADA